MASDPLLALQRSHGNRFVQRLVQALGEPSDQAVHQAAARGISTPAGALPHLASIQHSFGSHDVSGIKAHSGAQASESAAAMGAAAFATGDHVVFGGAPDLRTAAHEAAHVVQQRGGVQLAGGVGRAGDAYERHADAVADTVVRGESAEAMLSGGGGGSQGHIQRKLEEPGMYRKADDQLTPFVNALAAMVCGFADQFFDAPVIGVIDGYTARWNKVYANFEASGRKDTNFLHAAYGYAVESYTNQNIGSITGTLPADWEVTTQATRGMTRPDLVVRGPGEKPDTGGGDDAMDAEAPIEEKGWLDITSLDSAGHIYGKTGSGWHTRPYVGEIFYTPLNPAGLGTAAMSDADREKFEKAAEESQADKVRRAEILWNVLDGLVKASADVGNKAERRKACETGLGVHLFDGNKLGPNVARSVIDFVEMYYGGVDWLGLGYDAGHKAGRDRETAQELIFNM